MAEDFDVIAKKALSGIGSIEKQIENLNAADEYLRVEKKVTEKAIKSASNINIANTAVQSSIAGVLVSGVRFLIDEIENALLRSDEFGNTIFWDGLFEAAQSSDNFVVIRRGSGWNADISVIVNMDSTAGNLNAYARGVKAFRDTLAKSNISADSASKYWREKIYGGETGNKYLNTIRYRLQAAGGLAPYWQLLDLGNVPMSSDRGGTAYPDNAPTHFTEKTAMRMKESFKEQLTAQRAINNQTVRALISRLKKIDSFLDAIEKVIDRLFDTDLVDDVIIEFESKYGINLDITRLKGILNAIISGKEVRATAEGRVELTARGASLRVRPSLRSLVRSLEME